MIRSTAKCAMTAAFIFFFILIYCAMWVGTPVDFSGLTGIALSFVSGAAFALITARRTGKNSDVGRTVIQWLTGTYHAPTDARRRSNRHHNDNLTPKQRERQRAKRKKAA